MEFHLRSRIYWKCKKCKAIRVCSYPTRRYKTYSYSPKIVDCEKHEWKELNTINSDNKS